MICYFFEEPIYFLFSSDVPDLLYYSHIPAAVIAIIVGLFIFLNDRNALLNRLLFSICILFSGWAFLNLIAWTNIHSDILTFIWPYFGAISALLSIFSVYFVYVFTKKHDVPVLVKTIFLMLLAPVLILAPTWLNLSGFNIANCDAYGYENIIFKTYYVLLGILGMIWIFCLLIQSYITAIGKFRQQIILMGLGIELFLFLFFTMTFLASYLAGFGLIEDSNIEMYGLFGMTAFMIFIGILIVQFKAFNVKILAAQALLISLVILISSEFFFVDTTANKVLVGVTLLGTFIGGYFLVKSVKREVEQRERIEKLAKDLGLANKRLKELDKMKSEFVSIASHQLRSPITSIRGYVSMLLEGSYGAFPDKAHEVLEHVAESSKYMASSIEDYLNVSRIEAGTMKYEISNFDLKEQVESVVDELLPIAKQRGLSLLFHNESNIETTVKADVGKTRQVIMNFIDNALKYTKEGGVTVAIHSDIKKKKTWITIEDTGVGMSKETLEQVFEKFVRAKNANDVNTTGTGLGLYVAKMMISGMGGRVYATSKGEGHGSTFYIEYPLI